MRYLKLFQFLCTLLFCLGAVQAQPILYGLMSKGGANNSGTILKFDANNKSKSPVKSFDYFDGTSPQASLANSFIKASDGLLYGTVPQGGNYDRGMIVSYNPATGIYIPKYHFKAFDGFNPADGLSPIGSLLQATDGKLYGVTLGDYADVKGSIYSFDPVTLTHTTLKVFDQPNDPINSGSLIQASNGKLYGIGGQGGANGVGVIYSYDISTSTYTNLYHFETTNANMPSGNLLEDNGKLFGISSGGGDNSGGAIFRFNPETTLFSSIYSFGAGANDPNFFFSSSLSKAANGKFYGMSFMGGTEASGTIFSLDPTNFAFVKEYDFTAAGINYPTGNFMLGSDGKFYGTASGGGTYNGGAVFAFDPSNAGVTVLANLGSGNFDAKKPMGTLAEANGYLYGISEQGGFLAVGQSPTGLGTAYKVKLDGTNLETFHSFGVNTTGAHGSGGMIKVGNLLYGLTQDGGSKGGGTLFSYNPVSAELTVLHNFLDITDDGLHPYASLLHVNGKLYGTTQNGGKYAATGSDGVIFSYDIQNQTYEIVHNCGDIANDGYFLISTLIKDPNSSKIYGMSELGGTGDGTIFSFDPNTPGSYKIEYSFPGGDGGSSPYGSLAIKNGVLYGTTISGGTTNDGNLFSYDPGTSTYTNLASFDSNPASFSPFGSSSTPLIGSDGNIYLLTKNGGEFQLGTLSKYDFQTKTLSRIKDFKGAFSAGDDKDGAYPAGDLMTASDGKIYGMTTNGGNPPYPQYGLIDQGTIFSYDISTNTFKGEAFLDQAVGVNPAEASFLVEFDTAPQPLDSDSDGIADETDIDDDNDGITDDAENGEADLLLLNPSFELTNPLITTGAGGVTNSNMAGWKTTAQDSTFEVWQNGFLTVPAYEGNQFIEINGSVAATVYQDFTSTPGAIIRWTFAHRGRSGIDVVKMKVGPTGGTMVDITTASDGNTTWGVYTGVYTVPAGQTSTRIAFESVSSSNGDPTYGNFLDGIKFEVEPAFRDTDGDGIVNRLDLDSDGDGCSDAKEGGATTSVTANFTFSGLVGANGLTDVLETTADSGVINYTSTYGSYAIDAVKNKCDKDTDADGVPDTLDIDDDNDGITDDAENGEATLLLLNPGFELTNPLVTTGAGAVSNSNMVGWKTSAQDSTFEVWQTGFLTVPAYEGNQFIEINGNYAATVYQDFASTPGAIIRWTFAHRGRSGTDVVKMKVGASGGTLSDVTTASDGNSAWGVYTGVYTVPAGQTITRIAFESVSSSNGNPTYGNFLDGIKFEVEPAFRDTDGDGIVNRLDPDSDGDGCSDAKEGGATTSTGADYKFTSAVGSNGLADELETTVDNGEVKYTSTYLAFATDATKNACKTKPTFTIVASACSNNAPSLPLTSDNGVSGTWNPAQVNKASANTTKYVFTPSDLTTADTTSVTIAITLYQKPAFTIIPSVCLGATAPTLATTSNNGIIGTWTPSTINTAIANTTKYVFVPSPGGPCIDTASMTIAVAPCCVANVDDKYENNGSTKLAKMIKLDSTIEANIKNKLDKDYYKFTTTTAGYYTITFTPKAGSVFKSPKVELYNGNAYEKRSCSSSRLTSYSVKLNAKTTYYVEVEDEYILATACYTLVVKAGRTPSSSLISGAANVSLSAEMESSSSNDILKIAPNPTVNSFRVYNITQVPVQLRVLDALGRLQQQFSEVQPGSSVEFGGGYRPGNYFLQAIGSNRSKSYKLIKQ